MIAFFTDPYQDEALYSILSRYHFHTLNPTCSVTLRELFGSKNVNPNLGVMSQIGNLVRNIGGEYTTDYIIDNHTLFPFYRPFMPMDRQLRAIDKMAKSGGSVYSHLGLVGGGNICRKDGIYYCPECINEDREKYGESFIHREHQLPGVYLCPHHKRMLKEYAYSKKNSGVRELVRLEEEHIDYTEEVHVIDPKDYEMLYKISVMAYKLLNMNLKDISTPDVVEAYHRRLRKKKLLSRKNLLQAKKLGEELKEFYGESVLSLLECRTGTQSRDNWIRYILKYKDKGIHPIKHILLINFLYKDIESFLEDARGREEIKETKELQEVIKPKRKKGLKIDSEERLKNYKQLILNTRKEFPDLSKWEIRAINPTVYGYVYAKDNKWFNENMPENKPKVRLKVTSQNIDWEERDKEFLELVKSAYQELLELPKPVKITRTLIGRRCGIKSHVYSKNGKLPRMEVYLLEICETDMQFKKRKARIIT